MTLETTQTGNPRIARGAVTILDVIDARLSRRKVLGGLMATTALVAAGCSPKADEESAEAAATPSESIFGFDEITRGVDESHHVPPGYVADILLRWGDGLFTDAPAFDPYNQSAFAQRKQFGFNNDYTGYLPLDPEVDGAPRGLLCVNHEYPKAEMMFPGIRGPENMTLRHCRIEMAAVGGSIVEVRQGARGWAPVVSSPFNRRVTAETIMEMSGPAAGHDRLKTSYDASGLLVLGTMNNCAGGLTPWGTYLMAEENFDEGFMGEIAADHPEAANHARCTVPSGDREWGHFIDRFDIGKEPNEPNRFGWIVEVDVMDPSSTPKKRTALGRFKHEGATPVLAPDGRVVVYSGDDERFDYLYKFVSAGRYDPDNRAANLDLLDEGTLYVAQFDANGTVTWLPLVHDQGPLTEANGFESQADVLIEARRAGDLLEATPMDRPEDVEVDAATGRAWVMLTNNTERASGDVNPVNPRGDNRFGHIIEITEPDGDFAALQSRWDVLVLCGDPADPNFGATWNPLTTENGWFGCPDNAALDPAGRLWIATDGNPKTGNAADGLWALETDGDRRGTGRAFFRAPIGAEVTGPSFTPDGRTLFISVQHPGDEDNARFETPATRWPDYRPGMPPRPAVLAIRKSDGETIGS